MLEKRKEEIEKLETKDLANTYIMMQEYISFLENEQKKILEELNANKWGIKREDWNK